MIWQIEFEESAQKQLNRIGTVEARRIARFLYERIATSDDPRRLGKPLSGELGDFWRYRVGDYRIIADIDDYQVRVLVVRVAHRNRVYR